LKKQIEQKLYEVNEYGYTHQRTGVVLADDEVQWLVDNYKIKTHYADSNGKTVKMHPMCLACQARQVFKYENARTKNNEPIEGFNVPCKFLPASLPPGSKKLLKQYQTQSKTDPERALLYLKSSIDPASWCSLMFGFNDNTPNWKLRPYQKEQIRCSTLRFVARQGRRSGKSFSIALKMIYYAFTLQVDRGVDGEGKPVVQGPEMIIITPYQSQISNIFNEIEKLIKRNAELKKKVKSGTGGNLYIKTPFYFMELDNGATISGFVSGVGAKKDESEGGTIRGQNTDVIYLDEMDLIPDEVLEKVVTPLLLTRPGVILLTSSTPIGKRGPFFRYCKDRVDFKEDYYPSSVLPQWEVLKYEVEEESTEDGFAAEYMAHFIEGSYGVFSPSLVHEARAAYVYSDAGFENERWWFENAGVKVRNQLVTVIGIDWNKNAGSEFIVVAYDPAQHHWFVIDAVNISAGQFTSVKFKEEVVRLNLKWKPDYIYADEGYGHHIIDDLHFEAHRLKSKENKTILEEQTAKLGDRLKSFNFSQKVTLKSPIDGTDIVKSGKEFIVENAVRVFEEKRIWIPENDRVLINQLLAYTVIRRSPSNNKPIYGVESKRIGDHRLDAFMLALGGLFLENSIYSAGNLPVSKPTMITKEDLEKKNNNQRMPGAREIIKAFQKHAPIIQPQILDIRRPNMPSEEDVRALYETQQGVKKKETKRSRGDIRSEPEDGMLVSMWKRAKSAAGFATDEESLFKSRNSPRITKRQRKTPRGRQLNRRKR